LVRSGIGPRVALDSLSITRRIVCDAVGQNLQDHLVMPVIYETASCFTDTPSMRDLCRWQVSGSGPLASNLAECGGMFADARWQLHVTPTHYLKFPQSQSDAAMTIAVNSTRPHSRGIVQCTSTDPNALPQIAANYLSVPSDMDDMVEGVEFVRHLASHCGLTNEILPGKKRSDKESLIKSIRRYSQTLYHPVGTCALGSESHCPVQPDFLVRGCDGLWVADASVLPQITQGNPSVTLMSLGWLAAIWITAKDVTVYPAVSDFLGRNVAHVIPHPSCDQRYKQVSSSIQSTSLFTTIHNLCRPLGSELSCLRKHTI
jgi:choline dehydrogenase